MEQTRKNSILKWALIIGIVIVFNLFVNYAVSLVYKEPAYEAYFNTEQIVPDINNQTDCLEVGGKWYENNQTPEIVTGSPVKVLPNDMLGKGWCDPNFTKQKNYDAATKQYNRNVFIILVIVGVLALAGGIFIAIEPLALGFSWGGILSLIIASVRYWSDAENWAKVLILAIALGLLIWVAIKKFKD